MIERVPRTKLSKKIDIMQPITIDMLGNDNDPCFGKFFDGKNPSCKRCGDSEICLAAMGQNNHKKRNKVEKEATYLDLEEKNQDIPIERIQEFLEGKLKKGPKKYSAMRKAVNEAFFDGKATKEEITHYFQSLLSQSIVIRKFKKDEVSYLKLK